MKNQLLSFAILHSLILYSVIEVKGQATTAGGSNLPSASSDYIGWALGSSPTVNELKIKTWDQIPINFYVNNNYFLSIIAGTPREGDLDIIIPTSGLQIGDWTGGGGGPPTNHLVLWHNGILSNIYVGADAGNSNATNSNTFCGFQTGANTGNTLVNTGDGTRNTFVGHVAGVNNDQGQKNSFYGDSSGYANVGGDTSGYQNTFLGASSGRKNVNGKSNTLIGYEAGYECNNDYNTMVGRGAGYVNNGRENAFFGKHAASSNTGSHNSYFGAHAGQNSQASNTNVGIGEWAGSEWIGDSNVFIGANSGFIFGGSQNTFVGFETQNINSSFVNYSGGFGWHANAMSDNKIILGANAAPLAGGGIGPINVGIGLSEDNLFYGPRSRLEINADFNTTSTTGLYGSGLQFRQLTSHCTIDSNSYVSPYGRVLTVDTNGVVKLTDAYGYGLCNAYPVLSGDAGMDLSNRNIYYKGTGWKPGTSFDANNAIGIGYTCGSTLFAKLSVNQENPSPSNVNAPTAAGYFHNGDYSNCPSNNTTKIGIYSQCNGFNNTNGCRGPLLNVAGIFEASNSDAFNTGLICTAFSTSSTNVGGDFEAEDAIDLNLAVRGISILGNSVQTIGGYFEGSGAYTDNFGVMGITGANGAMPGSGFNIGVYGSSPLQNCAAGINNCPGGAAGYFDGDVYATGSNYITSDINLKDNVHPLVNAMSVINALNPKTFTYRRGINKNLQLPFGTLGGVIAQELQNILPNLVHQFKVPLIPDSLGNVDSSGLAPSYLAVNYVGLIPYLIAAAKEQQHFIDSLANAVSQLQQQLNNCCNVQGSSGGTHRLAETVELKDVKTIILNQNTPNPFSEETYIDYEIPSTVMKAMIIIYDKLGNVLKSIPISDRGEGSLHIYAENLSSGTYAYSLVCDGVTIDTKQMVCQK